MKWITGAVALLALIAGHGGAQTVATPTPETAPDTMHPTAVLYLVRHAETAPDRTADPPLSVAGKERAERLARMLSDAGLTAVHATPYRRTRGTADAVARATGLIVREYDPRALADVAAALAEEGGRHLVVGHSNTTPALVRLLGGEPGPPIAETEYDRVYVVIIGPGGVRSAILGYPGGVR